MLTLFPELIEPLGTCGIVRVARERQALELGSIQIRDFASNRYGTVDDYPYGGGAGMVMSPAPLGGALSQARRELGASAHVVLMSAQGALFGQARARALANLDELVLICGRYKGVDERFIEAYVDEELSVGDYVLSGGEVAACVVIDAVARLMPGVLGDEASAATDSIESGLLEGPLYTRPEEFEGRRVPGVLLSGHHARIADWRRRQALSRTRERRPDLLAQAALSAEDRKFLRTASLDDS